MQKGGFKVRLQGESVFGSEFRARVLGLSRGRRARPFPLGLKSHCPFHSMHGVGFKAQEPTLGVFKVGAHVANKR